MPCGVTACKRGDGARSEVWSYEGLGACLELLGRSDGQCLGHTFWEKARLALPVLGFLPQSLLHKGKCLCIRAGCPQSPGICQK